MSHYYDICERTVICGPLELSMPQIGLQTQLKSFRLCSLLTHGVTIVTILCFLLPILAKLR